MYNSEKDDQAEKAGVVVVAGKLPWKTPQLRQCSGGNCALLVLWRLDFLSKIEY